MVSDGYQGTLFAAAKMAERYGDERLAESLWELRSELRGGSDVSGRLRRALRGIATADVPEPERVLGVFSHEQEDTISDLRGEIYAMRRTARNALRDTERVPA